MRLLRLLCLASCLSACSIEVHPLGTAGREASNLTPDADCLDTDGDGSGTGASDACNGPQDCDDTQSSIHPGATEIQDGRDNNCDGQVDESAPVFASGSCDADGDGYPGQRCAGSDCNDQDAATHPGVTELCDGIDNNCSGTTDEGCSGNPTVDSGVCFDADGDGFRGPGCGAVADCDDSRSSVYPGAREIRDGLDNDCNGQVDESAPVPDAGSDPVFDAGTCDADGDGYPAQVCAGAATGDCDDSSGTTHPGAPEPVDGKDNDCNGLIDG